MRSRGKLLHDVHEAVTLLPVPAEQEPVLVLEPVLVQTEQSQKLGQAEQSQELVQAEQSQKLVQAEQSQKLGPVKAGQVYSAQEFHEQVQKKLAWHIRNSCASGRTRYADEDLR